MEIANHIPDGTAQALIEDSPISRCLIQSCEELINVMAPYKPDTDKCARLIAQCDLFA